MSLADGAPLHFTLMGLARQLSRALAIRRKRETLPTLFLPITRGPIQNFYHFFFGYFIPTWQEKRAHTDASIAVMSVAPHDRWWELLPGRPPKVIDQAKAMKHAFLKDRSGYARDYKVEGFLGWDKWERFPSRPLAEIARSVREMLETSIASVATTLPDILILGRDYQPTTMHEAELANYGSNRRNIQNLVALAEALSAIGPTEIVDGAEISPLEMVAKCQSAKIIIGQHGAALSNIFFAKPSTHVVEISWAGFESNAHSAIYGILSEQLGFRYHNLALQTDPFAPVDPEQLIRAIDTLAQ